ncbi:MAG: polysaccharide deacetylase family protein [Steroidobacteraceae bacterium]
MAESLAASPMHPERRAQPQRRTRPERRVALKIDVDTLRGTLEGVPALARLLSSLGVGATFYFSVGPDHTGRAIKRIFRPGFVRKVRRTQVTSHYGLRTLLYGTLLPGPHIGARAGAAMRAVRDAGFETGVHCHDHIRWQDGVRHRDAAWTRRELERAVTDFAAVFGEPPRSHAAAGWQLNRQVLALEGELGFAFASDTRGTQPFYPSMGGITGHCPQIPTTLPTFDELIGTQGRDAAAAAAEVARLTRVSPSPAHVFTLHAELEGMQLLPQFETLLHTWIEDGLMLVPMGVLAASAAAPAWPRHQIEFEEVPGRSGVLAVQGRALAPEHAGAVGEL